MTQALKTQQEEIENLKKHQIASQAQFKSQLDATLKQMLTTRSNGHQMTGAAAATTANGVFSNEDLNTKLAMSITSAILPKMQKTIQEEINKTVQAQYVQRLLDPVREQISRDMAEKMKSVESVLKDNVNKLFKSKTTLDTLAQSVTASMQSVVVNSYRDTFKNHIVPTFEKTCQIMYQQVNNSFARGTQDYLAEFDQLGKQHKKMFEENKEPIIAQMRQLSENMQTNSKQIAAEMAASLQQNFDGHLRNSNAVLQDILISSVKAIIKEEIQIAMRDQQHILPDRLITHMRQTGTMTPVNFSPQIRSVTPHHHLIGTATQSLPVVQDTKTQITNFLQKSQYNSAFQVALCASDLNLLVNLCELVNPQQVFEMSTNNPNKKPQCQLQQPVILSLIQQLSQDLNTHSELKIKYLEDALNNLDLTSPLTREHLPSVINQLTSKSQQFVNANPNHKLVRQMRMLFLASQALLRGSGGTSKPNAVSAAAANSIQHDSY